jgi:hypothetical protein
MRLVAFATAAVALTGIGFLFQPSASGQPAASRTIDRTLLCATTPLGGVREIEVRAHAGIRQGTSWKQVPFAVVSTGAVGSRVTALDNSLAWITAGRPAGTTTMDTGFNLAWPHTSGTVALNRRNCRASTARVPLGASRLQGAAAGAFGDAFDCAAGRRVLVRIRAIMQSPSALHGESAFVRTNTPVQEARMAVRTVSGKPLVYAQVLASGKSLLYTASSCFPD